MLRFHPTTEPDRQLAVILPHYNYEEFVREALDSLSWQDYCPLTVYIVDDHSTDNSYNRIQEWCEEGQPFSVVVHKHAENLFIGASLNTGHALAEQDNHQYFSWVTSDNIWYPNCFSTLMAEIRKGEYDLVYGGFDYFKMKGEDQELWKTPDPPYYPGLFQAGGSAGACFVYNSLVREAVGDYREGVDHTQDWDYWIRVEAAGLRIGYVPGSLGAVRCHPNRRSYLHSGEIGELRRQAVERLETQGVLYHSPTLVGRILPKEL